MSQNRNKRLLELDSALESLGNILLADIEKQAKGERNIKVDAQNTSLNGSAKADSSFKISKTFNETAAWGHRGLADGNVDEPAKQLGADAEFKSVPWAFSIAR